MKMDMMRIRVLKERDIEACVRIVGLNYSKKYSGLARKELQAKFRNVVGSPEYVVADEKGEVAGFTGYIQSWMGYNVYDIFWVNVHPKRQGKGIGTKLVKEAIRRIRKFKGENKAHIILLTTKNPGFYRKFGFKTISVFKKKHHFMKWQIR